MNNKYSFEVKDFAFMTAPMEDITDSVFPTLAHKYGADLTFTEMTRIDSLARNNQSTIARIEIPDSTPTQIQLIGSNEQALKKFLSKYEPSEGFKGFNLNVGCPSPHLVSQGFGCAMIKRVSKIKKLVAAVNDRGFSCSIKTRLGLNAYEKEKKVYLNLIDAVDADFFVVHARHGGQLYDTPADYSVFPECVALGKKIIANGDIRTQIQINELKKTGINGVMIGRAAINDFGIFNRLKGKNAPSTAELRAEYAQLSESVNSRFRYRDNMLKRLGKNSEEDKKELR